MKPSLVLPYHDPDGSLFPHLQAILPELKAHFGRIYLGPSAPASRALAGLQSDPIFSLFPTPTGLPTGQQFKHLYLNAAQAARPAEILHLAFLDRLSFALESSHRAQFLADVDSLRPEDVPLIFQRSPAAWASHPQNYARLEGFVTRVGETLFGQALDYGWCHLVVRASELRQVMLKVTHPGISMVAEMILHMQHHIRTRAVDWLAWEDPFHAGCDPATLKAERENSAAEYEKRLAYCLPMAEELVRFARKDTP
jgi:hypothetical protein